MTPDTRPAPLRFYAVVTLPAAILMALEIVSSRLLAPEFGNSVYVWGSIISVFLATMSAGYWLGGRLADRRPDMTTLSQVLTASAVFQALVYFWGRPLTAWLGGLTGGSPTGVLITTALLFGLPTTCLAMVSPFAVKIAARELRELGGTAGHLYALSTAGSLAGTLGATFFLIPTLALEPIFGSLLALTSVAALLSLGRAWREHRPLAILALLLLMLTGVPKGWINPSDLRVVAERLSPYQTLVVRDEGSRRTILSDGIIHSSFDRTNGETALDYNRLAAAALILEPEVRSMAVLGMGAGGVGRYLQTLRPEMVVDHVEVDAAVADIAIEYFGFPESDHHRIHVEDGRRFLASRPDRNWDLIYADTYIGYSIPFHLVTLEFIREVKSHLTPRGLFGMNVVTELDTPLSRGLLRGLSETFPNVYIFQAPRGNYLFLATEQPDRLDPAELLAAAERAEAGLAAPAEPSLPEIARRARFPDLDLSDAIRLTDRYAPVNDLLRRSIDRSTFGVVLDESELDSSELDDSELDRPQS